MSLPLKMSQLCVEPMGCSIVKGLRGISPRKPSFFGSADYVNVDDDKKSTNQQPGDGRWTCESYPLRFCSSCGAKQQ
jgi:hypothetical protein